MDESLSGAVSLVSVEDARHPTSGAPRRPVCSHRLERKRARTLSM
ncbi:hypothetical protein HSB1_30740 [Halogranum salarium B-1]|uniref:Uncharacterized protein n=1 Tax=Halogranum salarium B-1 TaxID=1210908 RepID=J3JER5_9EURY|nr:hypothetical protein HSB1_30740 [Halogranum salarium B-1]